MAQATSKYEDSHIITKEFLEGQLQCNIKSFTVGCGTKPGENYMSVLYSIAVERENQNDRDYYLLKCYPKHPSRQEYLNKNNHFYVELSFYQKIAKDLIQFQTEVCGISKDNVIHIAHPSFHSGKGINLLAETCEQPSTQKVYGPLDHFILMTDVRKNLGYKMTDPRLGLDGDHMKLAFVELATLHALSWAYRQKVECDLHIKYPFIKRPVNPKKAQMWLDVLKENVGFACAAIATQRGKDSPLIQAVKNFAEQRGALALESFFRQAETVEKEIQQILKKGDTSQCSEGFWRVFCHGDCWTNNLLFKYNEQTGKPEHALLLDFQSPKVGCPTFDLSCLVYTSTRRVFRQQHLQDCFLAYETRFLEICNKLNVQPLPGFGVGEIQERFQTSTLAGLVIALISLPLNLMESDNKAGDMDNLDDDMSLEKMVKETCASAVQSQSSLYQEWIVELVEDVYQDGILC